MYTVTDYSCVCPPPHDTVTRSSFKCHTCIILEIWSNTAITVCYFIQLGAMWRELYKQGFKCNLSLVVTTAVIPSQKCCLLGQVTLIHLHLSSMTEFSELGNGSQKVLCCDDCRVLNAAEPCSRYIVVYSSSTIAACAHACGCHNVIQEWLLLFSVTNNKGTWNNSLHHHLIGISCGYSYEITRKWETQPYCKNEADNNTNQVYEFSVYNYLE